MQIFQYKTGKVRSEPTSSGKMAFPGRLVLHRILRVSGYTAAGGVAGKLSVSVRLLRCQKLLKKPLIPDSYRFSIQSFLDKDQCPNNLLQKRILSLVSLVEFPGGFWGSWLF
jgi:hypothetical protein